MSVQDIRDEALKLPPEERERLAEELWCSIEPDCDSELLAELNRRWDEIVTGKVETIPLEEVLDGLDTRLAEKRAQREVSSKS